MLSPEGWYVGMDVCVVIDLNVRGAPVPKAAKIAKVGRRWITLDDSRHQPTRFDAKTRRIDGKGYASPGIIFESEEDYQETLAKEKLWKKFRTGLPWSCPENLTTADVKRLRAMVWPEDTQREGI